MQKNGSCAGCVGAADNVNKNNTRVDAKSFDETILLTCD